MQQHLQGIQHISLDLWLTLIKSAPDFKPLRNKLFAQYFKIRQTEEAVKNAFRHFDLLFNSINEKVGRNVQYSEMLFVILDNLGVNTAEVSLHDMEAYYREMEALFLQHHPLFIDPATINVLTYLQDKGISLNILSNTGFILGSTLRKLIIHLNIESYFCFQLYSDEMGCSKPSEKAFGQVFQETQKIKTITRKAILHVGDNLKADYDGSLKFGFNALLLDNENTLSKLFPY